MHCGSCVARISSQVKQHPHVETVTVDLAAGQMEVRADASVSDQAIEALVAAAGDYTATPYASEPVPPSTPDERPRGFWTTYRPLLVLVALLGLVPAVALGDAFTVHAWMRWFMAGFFLSFSYFKLLDVKAFADAYRMYDWIAKAVPAWGLAYPLVELGLGLAYAADWAPTATNWITLVLMLVLVLGDNLLLLFLGWEGVGLCSYFLIGFWYEDPEKAYAGLKAFVVPSKLLRIDDSSHTTPAKSAGLKWCSFS